MKKCDIALDCEDVYSTYKSLEKITGISSKEIKNFLVDLDIKDLYKKNPNPISELIFEVFKSKFNPRLDYDCTYWFHFTRIPNPNELKNGILPLIDILDNIWDFLYGLIKDQLTELEWQKYRKDLENGRVNGNASFQYMLRIQGKVHWGPHAFLCREPVLNDTYTSKEHYLKHPEIIIQICYPFKEIYQIDLLDLYTKNTKPCIVKFRSTKTSNLYLEEAIYYLFHVEHKKKMEWLNVTFDNNAAKKIKSEDIISIKIVDY